MSRNWRNKKFTDTLGIESTPKPLELSPNSLDLNEIDKDIYHELTEQYDAMADNLENGLQEYAPFDHLSEDIFGSLYKYNVKMNEADEVKGFSQYNHKMMGEMLESETYEKLRKSTKFDMMNSAIATEVMQQAAMEKIQYYKQQLETQKKTGVPQDGADIGEMLEKMNQAKDQSDQIDDFIDGIPGGESGMTPAQASELAKMKEELKKMEQDIQQDPSTQKMDTDMKDAMENAAAQASNKVEEIRDIVHAWGLQPGQPGKRIDLEHRKKSIERVRRSPRLKSLTDLIGRMKRLAQEKRKQKLPDGHSIETIETGNKLESVTPTELMKLASDRTKKDFIHRYHQKQLLQYKKQDVQNTGRGPIIVCHDKSSSMRGDKDNWSTALALATLEIAAKEKRNYAYIPYEDIVLSQHVKNIPAGELDPDDILDIAELTPRGGTDFMSPLNLALDFLNKSEYKKADILFITDGDSGVTDEWLKKFNDTKKEKQFFVNTVLINIGGGASRGTTSLFSDHTTQISTIAEMDDGNAKDIFRMIEDKDKFTDPNADPNQKASGN